MIINSQIKAISDLIRLDRPYGTLLLLLPTLWALALASEGFPTLKLFLVFSIGAFLMRSAGCILNDLADQELDRGVSRTRERPLAARRLSARDALWVLFVFLLLSALLLFFLNPLTRILSLVGLGVAILYPFMKRVTHYPQMVLGIAFAWGPLMAWTEVRNAIEWPCILIFLATFFWTTGYDTIYALMDKEDDLKVGIKSTALYFGDQTWLALTVLFGLTALSLLGVGWLTQRTLIYYLFILLIGFGFIRQIHRIKTDPQSPSAFALFKSHVGIGTLVLAGILLDILKQNHPGAMS